MRYAIHLIRPQSVGRPFELFKTTFAEGHLPDVCRQARDVLRAFPTVHGADHVAVRELTTGTEVYRWRLVRFGDPAPAGAGSAGYTVRAN